MIEPTLPHGADVWDLDQLRLPAERVGSFETRRRPPRHRPGAHSSRVGPHAWMSACRLPGRVSGSLWPLDFSVADFDRRTVGAWTRSPRVCRSPPDRPDAVSIRPSWPGYWPGNGSQVVSWPSPSWNSQRRRPVQRAGRCMVPSLGAGGSRPPGSQGKRFKLRRSVGSWRVGTDRRSLELAMDNWAERFGPGRLRHNG